MREPRRFVPLVLLGLVGPLGCVVEPGQGDTTSSAESSGTTTAPADTGTTALDASTTAPAATESSEGSTGEPPPACWPAPGTFECDLVSQGCGDDAHCVPLGAVSGLDYESSVCAPIVADPVPRHGACTPDPGSCNDDCDADTFCYPETTNGLGHVCVGGCGGNGGIDQNCGLGETCLDDRTCWPLCDPFDPQCPAGAPTCEPVRDQRVACVPWPYGEQGVGEGCNQPAACQQGLHCVDAASYGPGCAEASCCTELCDLADGDPGCSDPAHVCLPYHVPGDVPEGFAHIGFCGLPSAHPCLTVPGACPPDGIDDTYPWCSPINFDGCIDDYWRLRFIDCNDPVEPSGCACWVPCTVAADCPAPATGTAVPQCEETPGGVFDGACWLSCAGGETCPAGMTCSDVVNGECVWVSSLPPEAC